MNSLCITGRWGVWKYWWGLRAISLLEVSISISITIFLTDIWELEYTLRSKREDVFAKVSLGTTIWDCYGILKY